jgi:hypothetical protein
VRSSRLASWRLEPRPPELVVDPYWPPQGNVIDRLSFAPSRERQQSWPCCSLISFWTCYSCEQTSMASTRARAAAGECAHGCGSSYNCNAGLMITVVDNND